MQKVSTLFVLLLSISAILFMPITGCDSNQSNNDTDSVSKFNPDDPTMVKFNGRLFSVPSPIQIAMLVKDLNLPFNRELLNPVSKQTNYTTSFKQALNLGVYGANLGYLNIYEQLPDAASYFSVVRMLSKDLGIMNSFSETTMKRIENNNNNKDSLIYILSTVYRDADAYLLNNERNDVGVLILAGGWIESLFFMTQSLKSLSNQRIIDRIGEQKHPLNNLIELLRPFYGKESEEFDKFLEDLVELATVFDGVVIEYSYEKPTVDEKNRITIISSKSKTVITDYQLKTISEQVTAIRKKITD